MSFCIPWKIFSSETIPKNSLLFHINQSHTPQWIGKVRGKSGGIFHFPQHQCVKMSSCTVLCTALLLQLS